MGWMHGSWFGVFFLEKEKAKKLGWENEYGNSKGSGERERVDEVRMI